MNSPSAYRIIIIDIFDGQLIKVFASWHGGYLDGDSWRMNGGTELIRQNDSHYFFHGYSGSIYKLRKESQGSLTSYANSIYTRVLEQEGVREISVQEAIDILGVSDE